MQAELIWPCLCPNKLITLLASEKKKIYIAMYKENVLMQNKGIEIEAINSSKKRYHNVYVAYN